MLKEKEAKKAIEAYDNASDEGQVIRDILAERELPDHVYCAKCGQRVNDK